MCVEFWPGSLSDASFVSDKYESCEYFTSDSSSNG